MRVKGNSHKRLACAVHNHSFDRMRDGASHLQWQEEFRRDTNISKEQFLNRGAGPRNPMQLHVSKFNNICVLQGTGLKPRNIDPIDINCADTSGDLKSERGRSLACLR